jgi:predicted transcriptional regulator
MTITLDPALETYIREHAASSGMTVDAYVEALIRADRIAEQESIEAIRRGLADVAAGRVTSLQEFETEFRAHAGLPSRPL